jgi:hypothetical protein
MLNDLGVFYVNILYYEMFTTKTPKNPKQYPCDNCNFKCSNKKDYNRHLLTAKHKMFTHVDANDDNKTPKAYVCDCGKKYKYRQSLGVHKKKCQYIEEEEPENTIVPAQNEPSNTELLNMLNKMMTENSELCKTIKEMVPRIGNTTNNNTNNNTTNNFNVNMYLNNECNNAISLQQFSHDLQITNADILFASKHQNPAIIYAELLKNKLQNMDVRTRPIHCTDLHRGTLMIHNDEGWSNDKKRERDADTIKEDTTWKKTDTNDPLLSNSIKICGWKYFSIPNNHAIGTPEYNMISNAKLHSGIDTSDEEELKTGSKKIFKKITPEIKLNKETATC